MTMASLAQTLILTAVALVALGFAVRRLLPGTSTRMLAGVAGLLQAHRVGEAVPNAMIGSELNVVAAAVLGGASLLGGIGSVSGVVLGILLLAILRNGLNLLGVSPYFFQIVIGVILLASTGITGLSLRRRRVAEA